MNIEELLNNKENQPDWFNYWDLNEIKEHLEEILNNPQATKTDEISEGDGEFGLVKSNPIPVYGIPEGKVYLNKLTFENGDPFSLPILPQLFFNSSNFHSLIRRIPDKNDADS